MARQTVPIARRSGNTETFPEPLFVTAMSKCESWLKSPMTTQRGVLPPVLISIGGEEGAIARH
jgi:hypothetical protein